MKIYTKTGDGGQTGLIGGGRVSKCDPRVGCYGDVDELCALIGLCATVCQSPEWIGRLRSVQNDLFILGAQLATPDETKCTHRIAAERVDDLERQLDSMIARLKPLKNFVLPGGCELAARLHHARTVSRRAERSVVSLSGVESIDPVAVRYLNRLSDFLFACALTANAEAGVEDIPWIAPT